MGQFVTALMLRWSATLGRGHAVL